MTVQVNITLNNNTLTGDNVHARSGETVTLAAVDPATGTSIDGTWKRDSDSLTSKEIGELDVIVGPASVGTYEFTSAGDPAEKKSIELALIESGGRRWFGAFVRSTLAVVAILGVYAVLALLLLMIGGKSHPHSHSAAVGVLTILVMFLLAEVAGRLANGNSGVMSLVRGTDRRASTSKIQYLMWTLLLGYILAFVCAYASLTSGTFECSSGATQFCIPSDAEVWTPYLILLGVPAATAAVAKGVVSTKVANGTLQKTEAQQTSLVDVATNDAGNADLVDIQYLMFNLIAFVYVLAVFVSDDKLPKVPDLLLGLTSAAAGTYVLNKSLLNNKPVITSVTPSAIKPGDTLTVKGENLLVSDSAGTVPKTLNAKVAGVSAIAERVGDTTDTLSIRVPEGVSATSQVNPTVTVVTKANIEAEGFPVSMLPIQVLGWSQPSAPISGSRATLAVLGLPRLAEVTPADRGAVQVTIGGLTAVGVITDDNEVTFDAPDLDAGATEVNVAFHGRTSETVRLPIA